EMDGCDPTVVCDVLSKAETLNDHSADYSFLRLSSPSLFFSCCSSHPSFLLDCVLRRLLKEANTASRSTAHILFTSSTVKRILLVSREQKLRLPAELADAVLLYAHKFWDFVIDVVSYDATEAFTITVLSHMEHCETCSSGSSNCDWLQGVAGQLFQSNSRCRAVYKCMISLLHARPSLCLPFFDRPFIQTLYDSLANASVGVALTELLCECLSNGYGSWTEHIECLSGLLLSSSASSSSHSPTLTAIYDRLLPAAAKRLQIGAPFLQQLLQSIRAASSPSCLDAVLSVSRFAVSAVGAGGLNWHSLLPAEQMTKAILHVDAQVRFSAWSLLIEHPKKAEPFSVQDCTLMGAFMETNMGEQRPAIRMKILAGVKKALIRMVESAERLLSASCAEVEEAREARLAAYEVWIGAMIRLAFDSLDEEANFPRRLMALSLLDLFYRQRVLIVPNKGRLLSRLDLSSSLTPSSIAALIRVLDDSYEICQSLALKVLAAIHKDSPLVVPLSALRSETLEMLLTISTHITLATGYRIRFLTLIDRKETIGLLSSWFLPLVRSRLESASRSLSSLISEPLHPLLNAIELILVEIQDDPSASPIHHPLIVLLHSISAVVSPLVHNMSPEGFLPDDFQLPGTTTVTSSSSSAPSTTPSQMLLACAWRAHKHVSSILGWAASTLPYPSVLTDDILAGMAGYYLKQLTECKHCGAFESAVDGFEVLCRRMWSIGGEERGAAAPDKWLNEAVRAIEGEKGSLCLTRRSAGLPHLVVTILVTEPEWSKCQLLLATLSTLLDTEEKSLETRVHSCNVAKAIISCSRLAEKIPPALEMALLTAISGCSSPEWPARNASSQLLSALISRVFGVPREGQKDLRPAHHNQMSAAEFFARFPSLVDFLLSTLRPCVSSQEFSLFPSLVLLSHLFPTAASPAALTPFVPRVLKVLLSSRAEKVRSLAAVSLSAISTREDVSLLLSWIGSQNASTMRQNEVNAVMLMLGAFLDRKRDDDYEEAEEKMREILRRWEERRECREWCDWNLFLLLSLHHRLSIPAPRLQSIPPIDTLTLALRPLAATWIRYPERSADLPLTSSAFRHEIYRNLASGSVDCHETIDILLPYLVQDLTLERKETNRLIILRLLMRIVREERGVEKRIRSEIGKAVGSIDLATKRLPEESLLRALRASVREEKEKEEGEGGGELEWMQRCTTADDEETKELAIECAGCREGCDEVLLEFVQDESLDVREQAAVVLGERVYGTGTRLNPFVLRLVRKNDYGRKEEKEETEGMKEKGMNLFDVMVDNPYKENRFIGDCRYTVEVLKLINL
ncbi:hypothetical protein PFISCL1PPCAC_22425, partial [Pristionchus fissidentatus]